MSEHRNDQSEDLVNRAVAATRQLPLPRGPSEKIISQTSTALREAASRPKTSLLERIPTMPWTSKAIAMLAVAASVLVYLALSNSMSSSRAFAEVAKALENLRTATYDVTMEMKDPMDGKENQHITMKGLFLAPSRERIEMSLSFGAAKEKSSSILILDHQAMKGLTLAPSKKWPPRSTSRKSRSPLARRIRSRWCGNLFRRGAVQLGRSSRLVSRKSTDVRPSAFGPIATW